MKAVVYTKYGLPDVLHLKDVPKPVPGENEVLIKVHAATVNRTDCAIVRSKPFFMRLFTGILGPRKQIPGSEFAGEIESIGANVTHFHVGDRIFGFDDSGSGSLAQYMTMPEDKGLAIMPENVTYEQAAPSTEGVHYAFNFMKKVKLHPGQDVLVNGASGAIGSAMVQLLKYHNINVTAVSNTSNMEIVSALGADRVIDYTSEDFTRGEHKYDYVFDCVGKSSFFKCKRLLKPGGIYISSDLGYLAQNIVLSLITPIIKPLLGNKMTVFPVPTDIKGSVLLVKRLIEERKFNALIDRTYSLDQIREAYRYVEAGQKTGNVVITVSGS
jgi:NADPH:quinone reductase-like Zn-dependent oxidoreductase